MILQNTVEPVSKLLQQRTFSNIRTLFGRFRNRFARVAGFGSGETSQLGTTKRERCRDKDRAEALKAVRECARIVPVVRADVTTRICGDTTAVNDNGEDHETDDGSDLNDGQDELDCENSQYLALLSSTSGWRGTVVCTKSVTCLLRSP